jgi:hypothetical protein
VSDSELPVEEVVLCLWRWGLGRLKGGVKHGGWCLILDELCNNSFGMKSDPGSGIVTSLETGYGSANACFLVISGKMSDLGPSVGRYYKKD